MRHNARASYPCMRPVRAFLAVCALAALAGQAVAGPSDDVAARMERQATEFLDGLLGQGRARVFITVEGESTEVQTQSEVVTPVQKPPGTEGDKLPGYAAIEGLKQDLQFVQKDVEQSSRHPGFKVKRILVSVVLDSSVPEAQANEVKALLPRLLRLNENDRDDDMAVLKANLLPSWKSMALTGDGAKLGVQLAVAFVCVLLLALTIYGTSVRVVRTFVAELAALRASKAPPLPTGFAPEPQGGDRVGELMPGGAPSMAELGLEPPGAQRLQALGRSFDFIVERPPTEAGRLLSAESPEDLALLFCQLSEGAPDVAGRLFEALPAALQTQAATALAKLTEADPRRVEELEDRLRTRFEAGVEGTRRLGSLLSRLPPSARDEVMGGLFTDDPDAAREVERSMLPFEALANLEKRDLRRLMAVVPQEVWGQALRGAAPEFTQKVLGELPAASRAMLEDALKNPQPREKVVAARGKILAEARALAGRGAIVLGGEGAAELI